MIEEIPLTSFNKNPSNIELNYPNCQCGNCPRFFFNMLSIASRGQGKTYNIIKLMLHYDEAKLIDLDGVEHPLRVILISPTIDANPAFRQIKSLAEEDIHKDYSDELLTSIIDDIKKKKDEADKYQEYVTAYKKASEIDDNKIDEYFSKNKQDYMLLSSHDFNHYDDIQPQPTYKTYPVNIIVLDDLMASSNAFTNKRRSALTNAIIKNRHLKICFAILAQNLRSIPKPIRLNCSVFFIGKFANKKMILNDLHEEVSNILTEDEFQEVYDKATEERYGSLIIDCSGSNKKFYKGLDFELILTNNNIDK
jgi:hypothetical protein